MWEAMLPAQALRLAGELACVDALLDDPVFFAPFVPFFDPRVGGPSVDADGGLPAADVLEVRCRLGYESLCREVTDSITWRRLCRIPLDGQVPHPTTLMKLRTRCGTAAVGGERGFRRPISCYRHGVVLIHRARRSLFPKSDEAVLYRVPRMCLSSSERSRRWIKPISLASTRPACASVTVWSPKVDNAVFTSRRA